MAYTDDLLEQTLEELEKLSTAPSPKALFEDEEFANRNLNAPSRESVRQSPAPSTASSKVPQKYKPVPPIPVDDHMSLYSNGRISRPGSGARCTPLLSSARLQPDYDVRSDTSSIYEPLKPRAPSQLSGCSYSGGHNFAPGSYGGAGGGYSGSSASSIVGSHYSDQSTLRGSSALSDYFEEDSGVADVPFPIGSCVECHREVLNDGSGCSAMDKVFHIACFKCYVCKKELQGKSFFAVRGQPYCENDYLDTLEKCSQCKKPILERILRATGRPFHPGCFLCLVCGKCLDGVPFTVDASNNIYCIPDFHKKFAPRCCVCNEPIMPQGKGETIRIVALDRSFHVNCYRCVDCGVLLGQDQPCYPLDGDPLCKSCNALRVQALTAACTSPIRQTSGVNIEHSVSKDTVSRQGGLITEL